MSTTGVMRQIDPPSSSGGGGGGGGRGGSGSAPADDSPDVEVRKADQEMINEFGRLNNKYIELDEDLTGLKVRAMTWEKFGSRALGSLCRFSWPSHQAPLVLHSAIDQPHLSTSAFFSFKAQDLSFSYLSSLSYLYPLLRLPPSHPPNHPPAPQEQLEKLDDAVTELMVGVGGPVRLLLGEAFVEVSEDYATEYCERKQEQLQARVEELGAEKEGIAARQVELKKALYGRFGNSINLESS